MGATGGPRRGPENSKPRQVERDANLGYDHRGKIAKNSLAAGAVGEGNTEPTSGAGFTRGLKCSIARARRRGVVCVAS